MNMDRDEGQPLRKKVSSSLIEPTLLGYQHAFTRNATEIGWLEITKGDFSKGGEAPQWQRRWFELKDGVIRHAPSNNEKDTKESVFIPIENIIRLVTANKKRRQQLPTEGGGGEKTAAPEHLITMKTTHEKLILRAESSDDLNRWVFAFQRSVALAMTKIMMAQANSSMHHSLGTQDDTLRQHDADEALFLQEAAANEDDGWDTRRRNRSRNIMHGHANVINAAKGGRTKATRSMSIDNNAYMLPALQQELEQHAAAAALRLKTYKDRSFGDLTKFNEDAGSISTPTSPLKISWGQKNQADFSSSDSSPRVCGPGFGGAFMPVTTRTNTNTTTSSGDSNPMGQSTESINDTWRFVDDVDSRGEATHTPTPTLKTDLDCKEKLSPASYSVGRTRSTSGGCVRDLAPFDLSPSGKSSCYSAGSGHSSGSNSGGSACLRGELISTSAPNSPSRERTSSNMSGGGWGGGAVRRISEGSVLSVDEERDSGGGYMFGMDDVDSMENSMEEYSAMGAKTGGENRLRIEFGACTKLGPKTNQEDRFVMIPTLMAPLTTQFEVEGYDDESNTYLCENSYAAVYDGHCGSQASTFVNDTLHNMIFQHPSFNSDIELAIRECSESIDQTFLERARREDIYDGTTAIGAFFHSVESQSSDTRSERVDFPSGGGGEDGGDGLADQLSRQFSIAGPQDGYMHHEQQGYSRPPQQNVGRRSDTRMTVFNIGDSRAVLCRDGVAICMSDAHCPSRPDEQTRIEEAKGWITSEKELFVGRLHRMDLSDPDIADQAASGIQWTLIYRVLGEVSVSRSIGDYPYKGFVPGEIVTDFFSWPEHHDMIFNADLVISEPESKHVDIDDLCEFAILASDGLWDVVSNEKAVARVKSVFERGESPKTAAEELCNLALKLGSGDNTTVLIVQFFHNMKGI